MLPSLVMLADYLATEPTITSADYIGQFNLCDKTMEILQQFHRVVMTLFYDDNSSEHNEGLAAHILDMLYSLVSTIYSFLEPLTTLLMDLMCTLNYTVRYYLDTYTSVSTWMLPCCTFCVGYWLGKAFR